MLQPLIQQHDSSSERDSGTGDSRKSRDNLDEVDHDSLVISNDFPGCFTISKTKHGGGESTVDFEDFEDTTTMTPLADIDDDDDDDEEEGAGEAILSASNSLVVSNLSSANNSEIGDTSQLDDSSSIPGFNKEQNNINIIEHVEESLPVTNLRTFLGKNNRSLSRDFLNEQDTPINRRDITTGRGWRRMGGSRRKRASAVDINGEIYLEFERGCDHEIERRDDLDPLVYRGGTASRVTNGMEFHEKLLEHSFNRTDYSLRESRIMRNGRERAVTAALSESASTNSYVNSLPRSKRKKSREKQKLKSQQQITNAAAVSSSTINPPSLNLHKKKIHSDVAQRADELFS